MKEVAYMVECHDDHYQPTEDINRRYSPFFGSQVVGHGKGLRKRYELKNYSLPFSTGLKSGAGNGVLESKTIQLKTTKPHISVRLCRIQTYYAIKQKSPSFL